MTFLQVGRPKEPMKFPHLKGRETLLMPLGFTPQQIDPGMGTRTEIHSWGAAHRLLWEKLRESGRRIEVVAVAWEQHLLDRRIHVNQKSTHATGAGVIDH